MSMEDVASRRLDVTRTRVWLSNAALLALLLIPIQRLVSAADAGIVGKDFEQAFLPAADALLDLGSPYPGLVYPPLVAFLSVPFALTPAPEAFAAVAVAACVPASLWIFGVRDWRCYAAALLWCPVFNAVQTANVTLPLLLAVAVAWRWRDRPAVASAATGLAIATKVLAWPMVVWLAFGRGARTAVSAVLVAVGVTFGLWALLGFSGLLSYPNAVDGVQGTYRDTGYTFRAVALDAGLPATAGLLLSIACLLVLLAGVVIFARSGDERRSFACAAVAMVLATPLVWLHSFAFLLAPVALLRPRLSPVWFLPALLWFVSPGTGNGAAWQTVVTLTVAAAVVVVTVVPGPWRSVVGPRSAVRHPSASSVRDG